MKKIVLIISIILCLFIPIVYVYSEDPPEDAVYSTGKDANTGIGVHTSKPAPANATTKYLNNILGIRIGFVKANGENVYTNDYMIVDNLTDAWSVSDSKTYIASNSSYICGNKVSYMSGNCKLSWQNGLAIRSNIALLEDYSTVEYNGKTYNFNINYRSAIQNKKLGSLFDNLNSKPSSSLSDEEYSKVLAKFFNTILENAHVTLGNYYIKSDTVDENLYNLFITWEPITNVLINGDTYIGTPYELAQIASQKDGGGFTSGCNGKTALCDLNSITNFTLPCSVYLSGVFPQQMEQLGATKIKGYFSSTSYFGGAISINSGRFNSVCNTNEASFNNDEVTSNAGIGIGVLWISGIPLGDNTPTQPTPGGKYNCTPKYNVGTCINGDSIEYLDSAQGEISEEYWNNCVFNDKGYYFNDPHKESNKNSALTYYEPSLGSQYCEVYCIETLTTNFASGDITVEAGSRFMWGYSEATGGRTCKTKSVNWSKFTSDLKTANQKISNAYADWKVEQELAGITWTKSSSKNCDWGCIGTMDAPCGNAVPDTMNCKCPNSKKMNCACGNAQPDTMNCCSKEGYRDYTYTPSKNFVSYYITGEFPSYHADSVSAVCGAQNVPSYDPKSKGNIYSNAVNYAEGLVQDMKKCYTWDENSIYNTSPQATITYSDGKNYTYSGNLDTSTNYSMTDSSNCIHQEVNQIKGCSGTSCPSTPVSMLNCSGTDANGNKRFVEKTRTAITVFSLNADIFRYVLKSNNLSIHRFELPNYTNSNFTTNYYDVGESNFPVSYSIPDGLYGSMHGRGNLDLTYSNLGHLKAGQTTTDIDTILSTAESGKYGKWQCEFTVYSDLIPDPNNPNNPNNPNGGPGDIRVVYRTIDLIDPFPDIDGSKRNTGSNWCSFDGNCSYNNNTVKLYINNNRGVSDYEIYSGDPMYTFVLTPSIIKEIRRYNSVNSYADYTGSLDGKNYDYKCNNGSETGRYCISDYLSYIINITGAKNEPGSCVADKYRNYNDTANFEACRY